MQQTILFSQQSVQWESAKTVYSKNFNASVNQFDGEKHSFSKFDFRVEPSKVAEKQKCSK